MKYHTPNLQKLESRVNLYDGKPIRLVASDVEGCITPALRTKLNLYGTCLIQSYSEAVNRTAGKEDALPPIILVTGRAASYTELVYQATGAFGNGFNIPSVTENGAVFYDPNKKKVIGYHPMVAQNAEKLEEVSDFVDKLLADENLNMEKEAGKEVCISLNPKQMSTRSLAKQINERFVEAKLDKYVNITYSETAVDITPAGVNKRTALEYLFSELGIDPQQVLGIGDSAGDVSWLNYVGIPAAPENATKDLTENDGLKDKLFMSDHDDAMGLYDILTHFIFNHHEGF